MDLHEIVKRIELLEYHQKLLLHILQKSPQPFYQLIIEKGLSEREVSDLTHLFGGLNSKWEQQKAEGFVYFHPLFEEFSTSIPTKIPVKQLIEACVTQHYFEPLMREMQKYC